MSTQRNTQLPDINLEQEQADINEALKEHIEVGRGLRGNSLDRFVTVRELINAGLITSESDLS